MPSAATAAVARPGSRFAAIVLYTLRSCIPRKRWIGILVPCAGAVLFGLLARAVDDSIERSFAAVAALAIFPLVVPITSLVIGDAVMGAEVRGGTFHFTFLSPTPLWEIVAGRWVGGSIVALLTVTPACGLAAMVAGAGESVAPAMIAAAAGSIGYVAVFIAIGCVAKRAAVWSLAFVFFIEDLLGAALTGIAQLSPMWLSRAIFLDFVDDVPGRLPREGIPAGGGAIVRIFVISAIALAMANWRLSRLRLSGASD